MRRVLITGGAGFIGSKLSKLLIEAGHKVRVLDCFNRQIHASIADYHWQNDVEYIVGDIQDSQTVNAALDGIDSVFHLAAETGTGQSMYELERYVSVNDLGTAVLLDAVSNCTSVKDFLLASSRSIYGEGAYMDCEGNIVTPKVRSVSDLRNKNFEIHQVNGQKVTPIATPESFAGNISSIYAATKASQELYCSIKLQTTGIRLSMLRLQNVYGEGQSLSNPYTGIMSTFYNRIRNGRDLNIFEDGLATRDFVHVNDVARAFKLALERKENSQLIANIGSGEQTSILTLANIFKEKLRSNCNINISGDFRAGDIRHCFADISVAKKYLNFSPNVALDDGVARFLEWATDQKKSEDKSELALKELKVRGLSN